MDAITNRRYYEEDGALINSVLGTEFDDTGLVEPVTLAEVKAQSKIDTTAYDAVLTELITVARQMCEAFTNISFCERVVTAYINNSLGGVELPYGPVNGDVTSVVDADGGSYENPEFRGNEFRTLKYPVTEYAMVLYDAGYTSATLPKKFKNAVLQQVDWLYRNIGSTEEVGLAPIVKAILKPHRRTL